MVIFCTHCAGLETCKIYMSPYLWCATLKLSLTSFITVAVSVPVSECVEIIIVVIIVERQRFVFSVHFNVVPFACHSPSLRNLIWGDSQTFPHCHLIWPSHGELSPPPLSHTQSSPPARGITAHWDYSSPSSQNEELQCWRTLTEKSERTPPVPSPNKQAMHGLQRWLRISGDVVLKC